MRGTQRRITFAAVVMLSVLLAAGAVHAQQLCRLVGVALVEHYVLQCSEEVRCDDDTDCEAELEATCSRLPSLGCRPRCGTLIACDRDEACPAGTGCIDVTEASGALEDRSFCETSDIFCRPAGDTTITEEAMLACFTLPFSDSLGPSWFDGDCDRDGCPNGNDEAPCEDTDMRCTSATAPLVCDTRQLGIDGPEPCVLVDGRPVCATPHPCTDDDACPTDFECVSGACNPSVCTTLYACRVDTDCPDIGLGGAVCFPAARAFPALGLRDGFCVFDAFRADLGCAVDLGACTTTPDGESTLDLFAGDCDEDGCPNGIDPTVCATGFTSCEPAASLGCDTLLVPPFDAGMPSTIDASGIDAGTTIDAGARFDATAVPPTSFRGGGGCTCTVGAWGSASAWPWAIALLALRRRRPSSSPRSERASDRRERP